MESLVAFGSIFLSSSLGILCSFALLWLVLNVTGGGR